MPLSIYMMHTRCISFKWSTNTYSTRITWKTHPSELDVEPSAHLQLHLAFKAKIHHSLLDWILFCAIVRRSILRRTSDTEQSPPLITVSVFYFHFASFIAFWNVNKWNSIATFIAIFLLLDCISIIYWERWKCYNNNNSEPYTAVAAHCTQWIFHTLCDVSKATTTKKNLLPDWML